jgi:chromosome segregation ATPase
MDMSAEASVDKSSFLSVDDAVFKLDLCKRELAAAVRKNQVLSQHLGITRDADKNLTTVLNDVLNGYSEDHSKRADEHDAYIKILEDRITALNVTIYQKAELIESLKESLRKEQTRHADDIGKVLSSIEDLKSAHAQQLATAIGHQNFSAASMSSGAARRAGGASAGGVARSAYAAGAAGSGSLSASASGALSASQQRASAAAAGLRGSGAADETGDAGEDAEFNDEVAYIELNKELESHKIQLRDALDELARVKAQRDAVAAERDDLRNQLFALRNRVGEIQEENIALHRENNALRMQLDSKDKDHDRTREDASGREASMVASLAEGEKRLAAMRAECKKLEIENESLSAALVKVQGELTEAHADLDRAIVAKDAANASAAAAAKQVQDVLGVSGVRDQFGRLDASAAGIQAGFQGKIDGLTLQNQKLQDEIGKLREKYNESVSGRAAEIANMQKLHSDEIAAGKKDLDYLRDSVARMKSAKDAAESEAKKMQKEMAEAQLKADLLTPQLETLQKRADDLQNQVNQKDAEIRDMKVNLTAKEKELQTAQKDVQRAQSKIDELNAAVQDTSNATSSAVADAEGKSKQYREKATALQNKNDELEAKVVVLKKQVSDLQREIDAQLGVLDRLKKDKDNLEKENKDLSGQLKIKDEMIATEREHHTRHSKVPDHVHGKLADLSKQLAAMQAVSEALRSDVHPDNHVVEETKTFVATSSASRSEYRSGSIDSTAGTGTGGWSLF